MPRNVLLRHLKGPVANMPVLGDGEFYFATDQFQLYVGFNGDNLPIGGTMAVQVQDGTNANNKLAVAADGSIAATPGVGAATGAKQDTGNTSLSSIDSKLPAQVAGRVPVDGSGVTQPVSGSVSLGSAAGKNPVLKTGTVVTTTVTANQTILSYTVTAGKTLYLQYIDFIGRLTAISAVAAILGSVTISIGGTPVYTGTIVNPTTSDCGSQSVRLQVAEPIPLVAGTTILIAVTPASTTSMTWFGNLGGYEK